MAGKGRITEASIQAVRDAARIEDVVGEVVTLKPGGVDSLKGLCPFHDERTPSFHVRPSLGYYHCFGCEVHGHSIDFVMEMNHLTFPEAVEYLADKYGVVLQYEEGGAFVKREGSGNRQRLIEAHKVAEDFYRAQLATPGAHVARQFLANRGFTQQHAADFSIGYAPKGWDNLTNHLRSRGFTDQEIQTAGLGRQGNRGTYDWFRDRVMWPIRDITGQTIGFGGRRLDDSDKENPKYINTPETPIYKKAQVLYGLDMAKRPIAKEKRIVIVEGYTDVMAAHIAGVAGAVATCGTAFGSEHVKIARRMLGDAADPAAAVMLSSGKARGGEVIFTFDGDSAGQNAALKAFAEDQNFAAQTFVAVEPSGMDPCDLRLAKGDAAVRQLVDSREPLFKFVIRSVLSQLDLGTAEGRVRGLRATAPVVAGIKDRALRAEYERSLAGWLAMDQRQVHQAVVEASRRRYDDPDGGGAGGDPRRGGPDTAQMARAGVAQPTRKMPEDPISRVEREALEVVLQRPFDAIGSGFDELEGDSFIVPSYRAVHDAIRAVGGLDGYMQLVRQAEGFAQPGQDPNELAARRFVEIIGQQAGEVVGGVVTQLAVAPLPLSQPDDNRHHKKDAGRSYVRGVIGALVRMDLTRRAGDLRSQLQRTPEDDPKYQEIMRALFTVEERRQRFMEQEQ